MSNITRRTLLALTPAALLGLASCGGSGQGGSTDTIVVGMTQDIDSMDPCKAESAATRELLFNVYDGLVKPDTAGNLVPTVASDYTISPDGATYSFELREGVTFHDGTPVTAEDVRYSIERYRDSTTGGSLVSAFAGVDHVDIVDATHVDVVLKTPDTDFLAYFAIAVTPAAIADLDATPVGCGPYQFVSRSPLENVVLRKFDDYWDAEGAAHIPNVTFKVITNTDSIGMELAGGSIDLFYRTPETQVSQLSSDQFTVYEGGMNLVQALYLNNAVEPFNDLRVRQALCYAIDKQAVIDLAFDGYGIPLGTSMFPSFAKYYDDTLTDYYPYDPAKARELLAEAGYPDGFEMDITVPSNYQPHVDTAQVIVEQLKEIGVKATIVPVEWETWLSEVYSKRNYQSTITGLTSDNMTARKLLERFRSDMSNNFTNYSNPDYDELSKAAVASTNDEAQTEIYRQMERILTETAANVYIQDMADLVAVREGLEGLTFYPLYVLDVAALYWAK